MYHNLKIWNFLFPGYFWNKNFFWYSCHYTMILNFFYFYYKQYYHYNSDNGYSGKGNKILHNPIHIRKGIQILYQIQILHNPIRRPILDPKVPNQGRKDPRTDHKIHPSLVPSRIRIPISMENRIRRNHY